MKREYEDGQIEENVMFFAGLEVEHTPAYGMETLFVVGVQKPEDVLSMAKTENVKHIYFGANQSFRTGGINDSITWRLWEEMIRPCLDKGYWCTLDFDVKEHEGVVESGLCENRKFIPQISVKLPYLQQLGYNATIKIDDKDFAATNPGVWCHRLHDLLSTDKYTDWDQYTGDEILNDDHR
jgi:hypothetical protein